jgi:transposase
LIAKLDDLLLNHYNSAVVWLRGVKWVADIQVNIEDKYIAGQPEAIVGIDLNKEHTAYSIWIGGKEIYRAFDKLGFYYNTMLRLEKRIADVQANFEGNRKELSGIVRPLYDARKMVLRQYYGTLRNKILLHVPEGYNTVFVVEDLEYLPRRELGKKQRKWACQQLANGVLYNSIDWNGYKIVKVDPRGTTHTCYKCSRKVSDGRGRTVICDKCYPKGIDRDLNGARNIALRYMLRANPQHSCSGDMVNESLELNTKEAIQN